MKTRIYLTLILLALLLFNGVHAQVKIYKLSNGSKIEATKEEPIKVELNDEDKPIDNVLMQIDIEEFREKYNYDVITIQIGRSGFNDGFIRHEFNSDLYKKKYGDLNQFNIYAFNNSEYEEGQGNFGLVSEKVYYRGYVKEADQLLRILGQYITGQEEYYDEDRNSIRKRNVYSNAEEVILFKVQFTQSESAIIESRYLDLIEEENGISGQKRSLNRCAFSLEKKTSDRPFPLSIFLTDPEKYEHLSDVLYEIAEYKFDEIKQEKDKAKALELYDEWDKENEILCIKETASNEKQLQDLEEKLKKSTDLKTTKQKMEFILSELK